MPAEIVLVHNDAAFTAAAAFALAEAGHEVRVFPDPLVALDALEAARRIELLITRVEFPAGRSNGAALALMARRKKPSVKVLLVCRPEYRNDVQDLGEVLLAPALVSDVVRAAERLLGGSGVDKGGAAYLQDDRACPALPRRTDLGV